LAAKQLYVVKRNEERLNIRLSVIQQTIKLNVLQTTTTAGKTCFS